MEQRAEAHMKANMERYGVVGGAVAVMAEFGADCVRRERERCAGVCEAEQRRLERQRDTEPDQWWRGVWERRANQSKVLAHAIRALPMTTPAAPPTDPLTCSTCGATSRDDPRGAFCSNGYHAPEWASARFVNSLEARIVALEKKLDESILGALEDASDIDKQVAALSPRVEALEKLSHAPRDIRSEIERYIDEVGPKPKPPCKTCGGSGMVSKSGGTPPMGWASIGKCPDCPPSTVLWNTTPPPQCTDCGAAFERDHVHDGWMHERCPAKQAAPPPAASGKQADLPKLVTWLRDRERHLSVDEKACGHWASAVEALQAENARVERQIEGAVRVNEAGSKQNQGRAARIAELEVENERLRAEVDRRREDYRIMNNAIVEKDSRIAALESASPAPEPLPEWFMRKLRSAAGEEALFHKFKIEADAAEWRALLAKLEAK